MATVLAGHGLHAVGGFTPLLLHRPGHDPVPEIERILEGYVAANAATLVLSADSGQDGYDTRRTSTTTAGRPCWATSTGSAGSPPSTASAPCSTRTSAPWSRPRRGAAGAGGLLDLPVPGHRAPADRRHRPGRADPAGRRTASRTPTSRTSTPASRQAGPATAGSTYTEAVREACTGRWAPATSTSPRSCSTSRGNGYDGWYTLEQDTILTEQPTGEGPVGDVRTSADNLRAGPAEHGGLTPEPLRVGVLGAARIAELAIVKPAHATGTRLVAVAARDRRRAEAFADEHGVERVRDILRRGPRRPRGRGRLQPAAERAARPVEPRRDRGGQARALREAVRLHRRGSRGGPSRRAGRGRHRGRGLPLPLPPGRAAAVRAPRRR